MSGETGMANTDDLKQEVETVKRDLAVQSATQAGAQATQAATQAGQAATQAATQAGMAAAVMSGAIAFVVGLFVGRMFGSSK